VRGVFNVVAREAHPPAACQRCSRSSRRPILQGAHRSSAGPLRACATPDRPRGKRHHDTVDPRCHLGVGSGHERDLEDSIDDRIHDRNVRTRDDGDEIGAAEEGVGVSYARNPAKETLHLLGLPRGDERIRPDWHRHHPSGQDVARSRSISRSTESTSRRRAAPSKQRYTRAHPGHNPRKGDRAGDRVKVANLGTRSPRLGKLEAPTGGRALPAYAARIVTDASMASS